MQSKAKSPEDYLDELPQDRKEVIQKLRQTVLDHLPEGFTEEMSYGMLGYVVPLSLYPEGYHCDPKLPLPFASIASQKNFVALYHMGIYADKELLNWFEEEYKKRVPTKLDMGKSCIRFKKLDQIPYDLVAELMEKITPDQWIKTYEDRYRK